MRDVEGGEGAGSLFELHEGHTRREFLARIGLAAATAAAPALLDAAAAEAQETLRSPFGPDDERGAANRITPTKVLEAIRLVKQGKVLEFGRTYEKGMPIFGNRTYALHTPSPAGPMGDNKLTYNDDILFTQISQVGTQFDGLAHIGIGDRFYNGITLSDMWDPNGAGGSDGFRRLGVHNVGPIVTRGLLLDVAAAKGMKMLPPKYEISVADLEATLQKAKLEITPGDAVYIHTGWGSLWMKDNAAFTASEPGIGMDAAKWFVSQQIVMCGADQWGIEVVPNPNPKLVFPVHQEFITRNGIYNHENCATEVLVANDVREFLLMFVPLKLKGATGSPGSPIAIV
ncbi:MAG TPA: cyclase family protein [Thermodesulfobacteriota bacterium]